MSDYLDRAKAAQAKVASDTTVVIRLDLLEGLIGEIEALRREVQRLQPAPGRGGIALASIKDVRERQEPTKETP